MTLELDNLIDTLLHRREASWVEHLRDLAWQLHNRQGWTLTSYSLSEVKEITKVMVEATRGPLRAILDREHGTLRMGRALRQLGRYNQALLRELLDLLDTAGDLDGLLRIVAQAAQECELATARTEFMIVPDEDDLAYLLNDVEQYGARTTARMLIVLSALRYPRDNTAEEQPSSTQSITNAGNSTNQED